MFTQRYHAFPASQKTNLFLPKGSSSAAPTSTSSISARSKRLHARVHAHNSINQILQRCSLQLPKPSDAKHIMTRSVPNNPITPQPAAEPVPPNKHRLHASTHESAHSHDAHVNVSHHLQPSNALSKLWNIFHRFVRPYAMIGTVVAITSVSLLPLTSIADLTPSFVMGFAEALTVGLLTGVYNIAVNQLYDLEIDKINKPYLPLASGEISMTAAIILTVSFPVVSLFIALMSGSRALMAVVGVAFFLGSAYSVKLPLLRWKSNPFLAAVYMVSWGGILLQVPYFLHMQVYVLKRQMVLTKPAIFLTAMMSFFSFLQALIKDIPDVEGDKKDGVLSFAIWFGPESVFKFCVGSLMVVYGLCMGIGASSTNIVCKTASVLGHGMFASFFWFLSQKVDLTNKESVTKFYMLLWKLMSAEYFLIHFMR